MQIKWLIIVSGNYALTKVVCETAFLQNAVKDFVCIYDAVKDQEDKPTHHHSCCFFIAKCKKLVPHINRAV